MTPTIESALHPPPGWTELKHWHRPGESSLAWNYWLVIWNVLSGKPKPGWAFRPTPEDYALQGEAWAATEGWQLCTGFKCDYVASWLNERRG